MKCKDDNRNKNEKCNLKTETRGNDNNLCGEGSSGIGTLKK